MSNKLLNLNALLTLDATTCAIMGSALMLTAQPIAALTAIPAALLFRAGALLIPIAAFMALTARGRPVSRPAAAFVIIGNVGWVLASLLLPALGLIAPNALGWLLLIGQAAVVSILAWLETQAMAPRTLMA
jgi:hypothetical protein